MSYIIKHKIEELYIHYDVSTNEYVIGAGAYNAYVFTKNGGNTLLRNLGDEYHLIPIDANPGVIHETHVNT